MSLVVVFDLIMTIVAGFLDAIGFSYLSGFYVSFMSGNSTGLGVALAHGKTEVAIASATVIGSFLFGAFAGSLLVFDRGLAATQIVLRVEAVLLLLSALLVGHMAGAAGLVPVCVAMGMQNAVPRSVAGVEIGRSYVTGALFGLGKASAMSIRDRRHLREAAAHASSWVALIVGAISGSLALNAWGLAICLTFAVVAIVAAMTVDGYSRAKIRRSVGDKRVIAT